MKTAARIMYYAFMFASLLACSPGDVLQRGDIEEAIGDLDFRVLHKADYNIDDKLTARGFRQLSSTEDYRLELARYSVEVPAAIDFTSSKVLASTMGTQPRGGHMIGVSKAKEYLNRVVVTVTLSTPSQACVTTQAASNPYEFVELHTTKPVEIRVVEVVYDCT